MITDSPHIFRTDWNLEFNYSFDKIKNEIENNLDKTKDFQFKPTFDEYFKKDKVLADKEKYKDEYEAMQRMSKGITQLVLVGTALHKRTGKWVSKKLQNFFPETYYFLSSIPKLRSAALNILEPGTLIFFPAYVAHEFAVDMGIEPFRFIHFNLQAIRNDIVNTAKGMK